LTREESADNFPKLAMDNVFSRAIEAGTGPDLMKRLLEETSAVREPEIRARLKTLIDKLRSTGWTR